MDHNSIYIDLNIKYRVTKLSEGNIWENLYDPGLGKEVLEITPKVISIKENIWNSSKLEFFRCKRHHYENEKTRHRLRENICKNEKALMSRYVKNLQSSTVSKTPTQ